MYTWKLNWLSGTPYTHCILLVIQILDLVYWLNNYRVINESSTHLSPVICTCTVIVSKSICVRKAWTISIALYIDIYFSVYSSWLFRPLPYVGKSFGREEGLWDACSFLWRIKKGNVNIPTYSYVLIWCSIIYALKR